MIVVIKKENQYSRKLNSVGDVLMFGLKKILQRYKNYPSESDSGEGD